MSELDDFLSTMLPRQIEAERALHNGDPTLRFETRSTSDPLTIFGAFGVLAKGSEEVARTHRWVASRFSSCTAYDFELVAADVRGDLAYTVGYERLSTSLDGGPVQAHALRVTHVYRREDGVWKIVHRHGDAVAVDRVAPSEATEPLGSPTL